MFFGFLYNLCLKRLSFKQFSKISQMYIRLHVKYPLFWSDFNKTLIFWTDFRNICPLGAHLFHADGREDTAKLIVAFRGFPNAPKIILSAERMHLRAWYVPQNKTAQFPPYNINSRINERRVYCAIQTKSLNMIRQNFCLKGLRAAPSGRAVLSDGLRPLACRGFEFEFR